MHLLLWIGFLVWLIWAVGQNKMLPWLNKNIYSRIWSEEPRPVIPKEAIGRIKELCDKENIPEETAVLLVAQEHNITEQQLLGAFNAGDAIELVHILSRKRPNIGVHFIKKLALADRANMRR